MLLQRVLERNPALIDAAVSLHQEGQDSAEHLVVDWMPLPTMLAFKRKRPASLA
jgi:hypothetical protein